MTLPKDPAKREEYLRKLSERGKARFADPAVRQAESERAKAQWANPEARKLKSEQAKAQFADPEARARMGVITKKRYENPEYREMMDEKRREAMSRPEVRAKISAIKKAEMNDPARREWLREKALREMSDPARREISRQAAIAQNAQPGARERHSALLKEFYTRPEAEPLKQQARESLELIRQQPDYWERVREQLAGLHTDPEMEQKRIEGLQRVRATPEYQAKHRAAMEEVYQRPGYWETVAKGKAASRKRSGTDIELIIDALLESLDIEYEPQKHIGRWVVDFYVPSKLLVIECDGDYWHSKPEVQERDARKDTYLTQQGYNVLRLPGSQIHAGELDILTVVLSG